MLYYDQKESGKRIAALRRQRGLTQEKLAGQLNISTSNLGKLERGLQSVSIDLLIEISEFFEVSTDYVLLGREVQVDAVKKKIHALIQQLVEREKEI